MPEPNNRSVEGSGTSCFVLARNVWPIFFLPKVPGMAAAQVKSSETVPVPINCREFPIPVIEDSLTPMFVLVMPVARPATAIKEPS